MAASMGCEDLQNSFQRISQLLKDNQNFNIEKINDGIKTITELLKLEEKRKLITESEIQVLTDVIVVLAQGLNEDDSRKGKCQCLTECYRTLRNACAGCVHIQDILYNYKTCLETTRTIVNHYINMSLADDCTIILLRCAVQFLGNLVVGHSRNQTNVWKMFYSCFRDLLDKGDTKLTNYTCMVIHNCQLGIRKSDSFVSSSEFYPVILSVIKCMTTGHGENEWGLYVIQDGLTIDDFVEKTYHNLSDKEKILVLEVLISQLQKIEDDKHLKDPAPSERNILHFVKEIKENAYKILSLGLSDSSSNFDPVITVKQLEMLCLCTAYHKLYPQLRDDLDLVACCVCLLQSIHDIGKAGDNEFTGVSKASESHKVDLYHPSYGLKRDLIRIIGNLSCKNRKVQDKVRELNGVPLVLDLTNIDRKNPYITQWSVLAIHNLCEDNPENKAILSDLKLQGLDENVNLLQDFGINAELRGDKIHVKPATKK